MKPNLRILDKAKELMNKQVWEAAKVADKLLVASPSPYAFNPKLR